MTRLYETSLYRKFSYKMYDAMTKLLQPTEWNKIYPETRAVTKSKIGDNRTRKDLERDRKWNGKLTSKWRRVATVFYLPKTEENEADWRRPTQDIWLIKVEEEDLKPKVPQNFVFSVSANSEHITSNSYKWGR